MGLPIELPSLEILYACLGKETLRAQRANREGRHKQRVQVVLNLDAKGLLPSLYPVEFRKVDK